MRKFTTKQSIYVDKLLDEAWDDGYKAAEFDVKFKRDETWAEGYAAAKFNEASIFTAEANMKRAEAEFNKRDQPIEQRVQEQLGHPLYGRGPGQVALGYGTPDELSKVAPCSKPTASIWSGRHFLGNAR
jgi:hypothetical protein